MLTVAERIRRDILLEMQKAGDLPRAPAVAYGCEIEQAWSGQADWSKREMAAAAWGSRGERTDMPPSVVPVAAVQVEVACRLSDGGWVGWSSRPHVTEPSERWIDAAYALDEPVSRAILVRSYRKTILGETSETATVCRKAEDAPRAEEPPGERLHQALLLLQAASLSAAAAMRECAPLAPGGFRGVVWMQGDRLGHFAAETEMFVGLMKENGLIAEEG